MHALRPMRLIVGLVWASALVAVPAGAVTIAPKGTYYGHLTTICQATAANSTPTIIQSSTNPIYSSVKITIGPGNIASFSSAQHLVTNNLPLSKISSTGSISQSMVQATFTPSASGAASGAVAARTVDTDGSLVLVTGGKPGPGDFSISSQNLSGTYSVTPTTLTFTFGGKPSPFQVIYVKPSAAGVPTDIELIGLSGSNKDCTVTGRFSQN